VREIPQGNLRDFCFYPAVARIPFGDRSRALAQALASLQNARCGSEKRSGFDLSRDFVNNLRTMDFAIIETGGKQYKVSAGQKLRVEKLEGEKGGQLSFDKVLLKSEGGKVEIGTPYLKGAVEAELVNQGRDEKKIVFRYHSKTRYRKLKGHRQPHTEVIVKKI
jgi:large subunit ribosomal protein L21